MKICSFNDNSLFLHFISRGDIDLSCLSALRSRADDKGVAAILLHRLLDVLLRVALKVVNRERGVVHSTRVLQENVQVGHRDVWDLRVVEALTFHLLGYRQKPHPHLTA